MSQKETNVVFDGDRGTNGIRAFSVAGSSGSRRDYGQWATGGGDGRQGGHTSSPRIVSQGVARRVGA